MEPSELIFQPEQERRVVIPDPAAIADKVVLLADSTLELAKAIRKWADDLEEVVSQYRVEDNH